MGVVVRGIGIVSALLVMAGGAEAQRRSGPAANVGISFIAADPVGDLGLFFDEGFGAQFEGGFPISEDGWLRLRGDLGFLIYGHERQRTCYSGPFGCRVGPALTTTNNIFFGGLGPELVLPAGPIQPYVHGTAGFSYFATTSSLDDGYGDFGNTTNYSDAVFAWKVGGGIRVRVGKAGSPVWLDFGVERHENGVADFLTKGDIVDNPDGTVTIFPNRSEANLLTFRFGLSIGFAGERSHR